MEKIELQFHPKTKADITVRLDGTPYVAQKTLGLGAYGKCKGTPLRTPHPSGLRFLGIVVLAKNQLTGQEVAIKKIPKPFAALTLVKRTLREIRILRDIHHDNVVNITDMFCHAGHQAGDIDIYLAMNLMETGILFIAYPI